MDIFCSNASIFLTLDTTDMLWLVFFQISERKKRYFINFNSFLM